MGWLDFVAALVGSLAWPVVVVIIVLLFRRSITGLLAQGLTRFKAGPVELEWVRQVAETRAELAEAGVPAAPAGQVAPAASADLLAVAQQAPVGAILEAFARVERALRELVVKRVPDAPQRVVSARELARLAQQRGVLPEETVRAIEGLTVLRNLAAHGRGEDLDAGRATEYLALVEGVLYAIRMADRDR